VRYNGEHMSKLPHFPEFEKINLEHQNVIQEIVKNFETYSDYNYVSLFGWDTEGTIAVSELNDNLVVLFSDYTGGDDFLSFIGTNKLQDTIDTLVEYCHKQKLTTKLSLIPEVVINELPTQVRERYEITEDPDNHDYILSVDMLTKFESKRFATKRNLLNRFVRNHGERATNKVLDLTSPQVLD
jgi:hypothetical protein